MLKEITTFILNEAAHPYFVRDTNLFAGHLPIRNAAGANLNQIARVCAILENTGAGVIGDLPDRMDKPIQILNRNDNFFEARRDAHDFFDVLHGRSQCALPVIESGREYLAMTIDAMASPQPVHNPDDKKWFWFSTNYMFRICEI